MRARYLSIIIVACTILVLPSIVHETSAFGNTVNQVQTVTVGSTTSTSQSQAQQIINRAFKAVSIAGTALPCQLYNFTFLGNQGQYVSGNFTSDIALNFYIVPEQIFQNWSKTESCGNAADAIASQLNTTAYSFNVAFTSSGLWNIVLVNSSNRDADGFMVAYLSSIGYTITQPMLSTTTSTTSTTSTTPTIPVPTFPVESITIITLVGVVVLIAIVVLMALGYGRRKQ